MTCVLIQLVLFVSMLPALKATDQGGIADSTLNAEYIQQQEVWHQCVQHSLISQVDLMFPTIFQFLGQEGSTMVVWIVCSLSIIFSGVYLFRSFVDTRMCFVKFFADSYLVCSGRKQSQCDNDLVTVLQKVKEMKDEELSKYKELKRETHKSRLVLLNRQTELNNTLLLETKRQQDYIFFLEARLLDIESVLDDNEELHAEKKKLKDEISTLRTDLATLNELQRQNVLLNKLVTKEKKEVTRRDKTINKLKKSVINEKDRIRELLFSKALLQQDYDRYKFSAEYQINRLKEDEEALKAQSKGKTSTFLHNLAIQNLETRHASEVELLKVESRCFQRNIERLEEEISNLQKELLSAYDLNESKIRLLEKEKNDALAGFNPVTSATISDLNNRLEESRCVGETVGRNKRNAEQTRVDQRLASRSRTKNHSNQPRTFGRTTTFLFREGSTPKSNS